MGKYEWEFGDRVRAARCKAGLSQDKLADAVGVSQNTVSKWERGVVLPGTYNLYCLTEALNVSANYLVLGEE